ncbi:hypothetical protein ISN75_07550 [Dyella marensis]|uniref:hypothetical protein n=1 Tax=Dyella TaxID=231454 RepID=UPI00144529D2|nr:hypothetical protein [Dyella sp. SG609]NKJ22267.1 hypothetical protein [Dyella sp. SG609]
MNLAQCNKCRTAREQRALPYLREPRRDHHDRRTTPLAAYRPNAAMLLSLIFFATR